MAYSYRQRWDDSGNTVYVDYNISAQSMQFPGNVFAGDTITLECAVYDKLYAVKGVYAYWITDMYYANGSSVSGNIIPVQGASLAFNANVSAAKATTKTFTATVTVPTIARGTNLKYYNGTSTTTTVPLAGGTILGLWFVVTEKNDDIQYLGTSATNQHWTYITEKCQPTIQNFSLRRHEDGTISDEGVDLMATIKIGLGNTARKSDMHVYLYYEQDGTASTESLYIDLTSSMDALVTGVTSSTTLITDTFTNASDYDFLLWFGDQYEHAEASTQVIKAFANLHLSGAYPGGVAVGMFSTSEDYNPKFESAYPAYFYDGIEGVTNYNDSGEEEPTGGHWIDGKPIYRYILTGDTTLSGAQGSVGSLPSTPETLIRVSGYFVRPSDGGIFPIPFAYFNATYIVGVRLSSSGDVLMSFGSAYTGERSFWMVVEYTRADD